MSRHSQPPPLARMTTVYTGCRFAVEGGRSHTRMDQPHGQSTKTPAPAPSHGSPALASRTHVPASQNGQGELCSHRTESLVRRGGRWAHCRRPPPPPARGDYVGLLPNPTQALPCGPLPRISSSMFETTRQVTPLCFFTLGGVRRLNRSRHVVRKAKSDNNLESAGLTAQQLSELTACCGVACVMVAVVCARPPPDGLTSASSQ